MRSQFSLSRSVTKRTTIPHARSDKRLDAALLRPVCVAAVVFLLGIGVNRVSAQEFTSIKLFDATSTFDTGPITTSAEAVPFATKSFTITMAPGNTAKISSTPDGTGDIVIDNFLTINGENACLGVAGQSRKESCFGRRQPLKVGEPIETILEPIPPIDVSALIPVGTTPVLFELRDFGRIAGNTNLFLVTNAVVNLPTRLTPSPSALKQAFDDANAVCKDSINTSARTIFNESFTKQITEPIIERLKSVRANKHKIDQISDQLEAAKQDLGDELTDGFETFLKSVTLPSVPRSSEIIREMTGAPVLVGELKPELAAPQVSTSQTIKEILATGFDPTLLEVSWDDVAATCSFVEDSAPPQPVFTPKVDLTLKKLPGGGTVVSGSVQVNVKTVKLKVEGSVDTTGAKSISVSVSF